VSSIDFRNNSRACAGLCLESSRRPLLKYKLAFSLSADVLTCYKIFMKFHEGKF